MSKVTMSARNLAEMPLNIGIPDCYNNESSRPAFESAVKDAWGSFSKIVAEIREIKDDSYCISATQPRDYTERQRRIWDSSYRLVTEGPRSLCRSGTVILIPITLVSRVLLHDSRSHP